MLPSIMQRTTLCTGGKIPLLKEVRVRCVCVYVYVCKNITYVYIKGTLCMYLYVYVSIHTRVYVCIYEHFQTYCKVEFYSEHPYTHYLDSANLHTHMCISIER